MRIGKPAAVAVLREAAKRATEGKASSDWRGKVEKLSTLCEAANVRTHLALLVTSMLAKACDANADLIAFKPDHAPGNANAYSARSLCHGVVVPLAAELGFSIGVTGREPLNNQPYFRMERLDDGTPVLGASKPAFKYLLALVEELQTYNEAGAKEALAAYVAVMRTKVVQYDASADGIEIHVRRLVNLIEKFVSEDSEGGRRAQAVVAGLLDVFAGVVRVESGRINDPSRKYPGDVCVRSAKDPERWERAFEVRDKPASVSDMQIFARKCLTFGLREAAIVMVSSKQPPINDDALATWAEENGVVLTLFYGWHEIVLQSLFWSAPLTSVAATMAIGTIHERLKGVEASPAAVQRWNVLVKG